jgi:hypothetical protein
MTYMFAPLAFAVRSLKDINEITPRQPAEDACFAELQAVLKRHKLEKRYGITLLHKHFDIADDEMLVEHTDLTTRTLTSRPQKIGSIPNENVMEVTWSMDTDTTMGICVTRCFYNQNSTPQHVSTHTAEGP